MLSLTPAHLHWNKQPSLPWWTEPSETETNQILSSYTASVKYFVTTRKKMYTYVNEKVLARWGSSWLKEAWAEGSQVKGLPMIQLRLKANLEDLDTVLLKEKGCCGLLLQFLPFRRCKECLPSPFMVPTTNQEVNQAEITLEKQWVIRLTYRAMGNCKTATLKGLHPIWMIPPR